MRKEGGQVRKEGGQIKATFELYGLKFSRWAAVQAWLHTRKFQQLLPSYATLLMGLIFARNIMSVKHTTRKALEK